MGNYTWSAQQTVDLKGKFVIPGLIDSHMHLESTLLMPAELARLIVPHGTTATISDSHEIGNVLGIPGIEMLIAQAIEQFKLWTSRQPDVEVMRRAAISALAVEGRTSRI